MNILFNFSEVKGFSINFNLYETNILNLIIVIGVLIYYGKPLCFNLVINLNFVQMNMLI